MPSRFVLLDDSWQSAHGAIMKPFSRSGAIVSRQNFTSPAMLLFTAGPSCFYRFDFQFDPHGTWSKPALSSVSNSLSIV